MSLGTTTAYGPTISGPGIVQTSGATSLATQTSNYTDLYIGNGATWVNTGTVTDGGLITTGLKASDTATFVNQASGVFNLTTDLAGISQQYGNQTITFNNAGLLEKTGGSGNSTINASLVNTGTISVTTGTLTLAAGGTLGGVIIAGGTGTLAFSGGSFTETGSISGPLLIDGGTLTLATAGSLSSGLTETSGILAIAASSSETGSFTATAGTIAVSSGQTLSLSGAVSLGTTTAYGPTISGPGIVQTSGATSLATQTSNYTDLYIGNGATWVNTGTVTDGGLITTGLKASDTATFVNQASGVFNLTTDLAGISQQYGNQTITFNNAGLLEKTGGSGNSTINASLVNTGTISVTTGTLTLAAGGTLGGVIIAGGTGTLAFSGGSFTETGSISGPLLIDGGTLTLATAGSLSSGLTETSGILAIAASSSETGSFTATAGTIAVSSGQTLSLSGAVSLGTTTAYGPTISGPGIVQTSGATSLATQTSNYTDLYIGNGATWVNTGTVTDGGLITTGLKASDTATFVNQASGVFNLTTDLAGISQQYGNQTITFNNAGLLEKTGGSGNSTINASLVNTGTISVTTGTLTLAAGGTLGGVIIAGGTGTLAFSGGSFTETGSISGPLLIDGGTLTLATAGSLSSGLTETSGILAIAASSSETGSFTATAGTIAVSSGQTLSLSGAVSLGTTTAYGPTISGPGIVQTSGATSLATQTSGYTDLYIGNGATWVNTGTVTDGGLITTGLKASDTATFVNQASGVFNLTTDLAGISQQYGNQTITFNNAGLLEKTGGSGNSTINASLVNTGTISVTTGTLTLAAGGTLGGVIIAGGTGTLAFSGGSFTETGSISGPLLIDGGTLTLATAASLSSGLTETSGTLAIAASSSETGSFTATAGTIAVSSGQTLSLSGAVSLGTTTAYGPTISGPGIVQTSGATSLATQTSGYTDLFIGNGATWVNTGTVTDGGLITTGLKASDTATFVNQASGVFNLTTALAGISLQYGNQTITFNNAGLLEKTGGSGNSTINASLVNTGTIKIDQGSTLTLSNAFTDAGRIVLAGGVLSTTALTLAAGATLSGFGTLSAATPVNNGLIDASGGVLVLTKTPTGTGVQQIEAGSTLELTTASADAVTFNGLGSRLRIDVPASYTGTLTSVAAGDGLVLQGVSATSATSTGTTVTVNLAGGGTETFTTSAALTGIREGVTQDGSGNSSIVFYRYANPAATPNPVAFGNHHVGDTITQALTLGNSAAADGYSEALDASLSNGSAGISTAGTVALLAAGGTSSKLSTTLLTATAGSKSGTATINLQTDGTGIDGDPALALPSQTLNVTGAVYNYATAGIAPSPLVFANHHVGDTVTQALMVSNTAAAGAFSENLNALFSGASGSISDMGTIAGLAAGASSTALSVTLATTAAGAISGSATLGLVSDGGTIDSLGITALAAQTVAVSGKVYNYATASVLPTSVAFANRHVGDTATQSLIVGNTAATGSFSELLDAGFVGVSGAVTDSGSINTLAAGASSTALGVTLATGAAGAISGAVTLGLTSDGSTIDGLATTALAAQVVQVAGSVYNYASAALTKSVNFGVVHVGDTVTSALTLSNTAPSTFSDVLDAQFTGATGAVSDTGTISALAAGSSSSALGVALNTVSAGTLSGTATVSLMSDGTGEGLGLTNLSTLAVSATGTVDNYATAALTEASGGGTLSQSGNNYTLDLGSLTIGSAPASAIFNVTNSAATVADSLQGSFQATAATGFTNTGFASFSGLGANQSASAGTITVATGTAGSFTETITLSASGANSSGYLGALPTETLTIKAMIVCFLEGTHIATPTGERCVETLRIGDLVTTVSGASRPIRWLGHRTVDCRMHPRQEEANPIRIARHAFGENKPARDLYVSPAHCICVDRQGEVLIPASALANGSTITQIETDQATYWHVELDSHDILIANGLPAESYIDMGNRPFFVESGVVAFDASPDHGRLDPHLRTPTDFCRPLVTDGPILDAIRAELSLQAEALGWTMTHSPLADLHLDVGGKRIDPVVRGLIARFAVPADAGDVWLVSNRSRPCDVVGGGDDRHLGVCLAELTIDDGFGEPSRIMLDHPLLSTGFNLFEQEWRWTAGYAYLPAALWDQYRNGFFLRVHLTSPALPHWVKPPTLASSPSGQGNAPGLRA